MMDDIVSTRQIEQTRLEGMTPDAPPAPTRLEGPDLAPNPFEADWAGQGLRPQTEADQDAEAGIEDVTGQEPSTDEDVETQPGSDEEDVQATEPDEQSPTPEYLALKEQNRLLMERLERLEAQNAAPQEPIDTGLSWDGLELAPAPEELADYDEFLTKRMTQIAEHVWGFAERRAQQVAAQEQRSQAEQSLRSQIQDMVADPAFADYESYYPKMKELAQRSPALLTEPNGLKALYFAAKGSLPTMPAQNGNGRSGDEGYARGVKAGLQKVQAKRQSAVEPPRPGQPDTRPVRTENRTLEQALREEFALAKEQALRRQ